MTWQPYIATLRTFTVFLLQHADFDEGRGSTASSEANDTLKQGKVQIESHKDIARFMMAKSRSSIYPKTNRRTRGAEGILGSRQIGQVARHLLGITP